jgi:NAD(P)-dependent dehydrogenase (short-subunit alcohol dehydrogenase family)
MTEQVARPLSGKVAWLTGASRGIGRAMAHGLALAGAEVVMGARNLEMLETVALAIHQGDGKAHALALDVSDPESCRIFAAAALELAGPPDVLVNNAGVGIFRPVDEFRPDEFERQFRVNVFGPYYMTREVVPHMKLQGSGHIVNVSSLAGESEAKMASGYFATKHALNGFTKCVLQDVREHGIRVTLLCPGSVDTRFHQDSHPGSHSKDQTWMVTPEQVARTLVHVLKMPEEALVSRIDIRPARLAQK